MSGLRIVTEKAQEPGFPPTDACITPVWLSDPFKASAWFVVADLELGSMAGANTCIGDDRVTSELSVAPGVEATPHATCAEVNRATHNKCHLRMAQVRHARKRRRQISQKQLG